VCFILQEIRRSPAGKELKNEKVLDMLSYPNHSKQ
jgi:hypothetical protein